MHAHGGENLSAAVPITGPPEWLCAGLELAACTPISVPMAWALCRELEHCMGTAREGGLGVTAPPGRVTDGLKHA